LDRALSPDDKKRIVDLYEDRFEQFGWDVRTVGWSSRNDQNLRFSVLCRGIELEGRKILDVGCGLGDFVGYLDEFGAGNYDYLGIDISPKLIEEAGKRYGGSGRRFAVLDLLDQPHAENFDAENFDVVVSSGMLSFRVADNMLFAKQMIAKMFAMCRGALAVNFLTSYVDYQLPKNFHYEPETMFGYARTLTHWVRLHHDYPLYEFTLQLFREPNVCEQAERRKGAPNAGL
jgi:SAM-dependent methyltransferase